MLKVNERLYLLADGINEVVAICSRVEPDDIRAEHSIQDFFSPRTNTKLFRRRPRNVPEEPDFRVRPFFFYHARKQCEMEVLHQNNRFLHLANLRKENFRELTVDTTIFNPVFLSKERTSVREMTERPERFVGKTNVVAFDFLRHEEDSSQRIARLIWRHGKFPLRVSGFFIGVAAPVRKPESPAGLHDWFKRRYHTACRHRILYAVFCSRMDIGFAVGYHEYFSVFHVRFDELFEPLRRPWVVYLFQPHARFLARGKARLRQAHVHFGYLARERFEEKRAAERRVLGLAYARGLHRVGESCDDFVYRETNQRRDGRGKDENVDEEPDNVTSPNLRDDAINVGGVLHGNERAHDGIFLIERQDEKVTRGAVDFFKKTGRLILIKRNKHEVGVVNHPPRHVF